jgi:putative endopeptidase
MNKTKKNSRIDVFEDKFRISEKKWLQKNRTIRYKKRIELFKKFYYDKKYTPQDDFYNWANKDWLNQFQITKGNEYIVEFDDFRLVQDKVYRELLEIVENYIKTSKDTTFGKCLDNFYNSTKTFTTVDDLGKDAKCVLSKIDDVMKKKDGLWELLGYMNRIGGNLGSFGLPLVYNMKQDEKDPNAFRPLLNGPIFGLVDINVYFKDGTNNTYKENYKRQYLSHVRELFEIVFGKNHDFEMEDIFNVQVELLGLYGYTTEKEGDNNYNRVTAEEALSKYQFNWNEFCKALGFDKIPKWFITSSLNYLKYGTSLLLKEWNTKAFRTYFIFCYIRQTCLFCKKTKNIIYDFRGKFERGEKGNVINYDVYSVYPLGLAFNTFLSNEYIKYYKNDTNIEILRTLIKELILVFMRIISHNKWLSPKTKAGALLKLKTIKIILGSPSVLRKDPILNYDRNNLLKNMLEIVRWRFNQTLLLNGVSPHNIDIPTMDWNQYPPKFTGTQAYVVNASYTPSLNTIYVPLGYIQKPFIDTTMSVENMLAHVGFTVGHEMSHCLDDWGSKYDHTGKLHNWWTKEDHVKYKSIEKDILKQYKEFAKRDGVNYEVEQGLGEDMADISGLAICVEYLADLHNFKNYTLPIQKLSFEQFFVYYAQQYRQQIYKKALSADLKTNPHPLNKYRTNIPLSRQTLFREIYKITKKDKMWWHNTNTIW